MSYTDKSYAAKGQGVRQMLTGVTKGGGGVGDVLTMADEGGRGVGTPPCLADKIFEQPLMKKKLLKM